MNILHIAYWYPHYQDPLSGSWIRAHIRSLLCFSKGKLYHIEVQGGKKWYFFCGKNIDQVRTMILYWPLQISRINEWISVLGVAWILFRERKGTYDCVNFHIAYPNAVYLRGLTKLFGRKAVITEHWSAYHFQFHQTNRHRLRRIIHIFKYPLGVLSVSEALSEDIRNFSQYPQLRQSIVPNVVDTELFYDSSSQLLERQRHAYFLAVSRWKLPKQPLILIEAWKEFVKHYPDMRLRIGGFGEMWKDMQQTVKDLGMSKHIDLLGRLTPQSTACEMQKAEAFVHVSNYETFSVVCAEALCCGTPIIVSNKGALPELISKANGLLISKNTSEGVLTSLLQYMKKSQSFQRAQISQEAIRKFSPQAVGKQYYEAIREHIK